MLTELLAQKKDCLSNILKITNDFGFVGEEGDSERFASMVDDREVLFEEIKGLDKKMQECPPDDGMAAKALHGEIQSLVKSIINQNKLFEGNISEIMAHLKDGIKDVNNTRNINLRYNYDTMASSGMLLDEKK
jgi:hypothetical protein